MPLHGVQEFKPGRVVGDAQGDVRVPRPAWATGEATTLGFMLSLVARCGGPRSQGDIVICRPQAAKRECGELYGPGFERLGIAPSRVVLVETRDEADCLWAIEEALRARAACAVIGVIETVGLTPARRLALAAADGRTPCLMMTHREEPALAATHARWRIAQMRGASDPLAEDVPGKRRYGLSLERMRGAPSAIQAAAQGRVFALEWCHETVRFDLVSRVRDRTSETRHTPWAQAVSGSTNRAEIIGQAA
ncbi:MAG: hypothetical protein AAFR23_08950 [Pseudomonadota bacterium]